MVQALVWAVFGTSGATFTGNPRLSLPLPAHADFVGSSTLGNGYAQDASPAERLPLGVQLETATNCTLWAFSYGATYSNLTIVSSTVPFAWAAGDSLEMSINYLAA